MSFARRINPVIQRLYGNLELPGGFGSSYRLRQGNGLDFELIGVVTVGSSGHDNLQENDSSVASWRPLSRDRPT